MCVRACAVPPGLRRIFHFPPGTSVPGYHMPPLRGWSLADFVPPLSQRFSSHAHTKVLEDKQAVIAGLQALRHPKPSSSANCLAAVRRIARGAGSQTPAMRSEAPLRFCCSPNKMRAYTDHLDGIVPARTCSGVHPNSRSFRMLNESCRFASRMPASSRTKSQ